MLIRFICLGLVRLFYRHIRVTGREHVPSDGPVIVVSNHMNGLVDPLVIRMAIARPVSFLAKSTLFGNWIGRLAMRAFSAIPVYRQKEADTTQNRRTFEMSNALLRAQGWLALFPEGVSHSEPVLQPLKSGAARIALSTDAALDVQILPIGLDYEAKEKFRSSAAATVGVPFGFSDLRALHANSPRQAAQALTQRIAERLGEVVLQAEDHELWHGFRFVARWIQKEDDDAMARRLSAAYRQLRAQAPERADALVEEAREFARVVSAAGVKDPRALEMQVSVVPLIIGFPFALLGALLAWLPYRVTGPLARRLAAGETDLVSTIKALLGLLLIGGTYIVEAVVAGLLFGWPWGVCLLVLAPLLGFVAMRYGDLLTARGGRGSDELRRRREVFVQHILDSLPGPPEESSA